MSHKKNTLLVIITITFCLTYGHKLYGYVEQTFIKLTAISSLSEPLKTDAFDGNKERTKKYNHQVKNPLPQVLNHQKQDSNQLKTIERNSCSRPQLRDLTTENQGYIKADGSEGYRILKKYYYLKTNLGESFKGFLNELNTKLNATFQHIESQLHITLNQAISLNLVFQTTRADYKDYLLKLGISPEGNQGIYLPANNLSIVEIKTYEQGIKTAIHEAIHAFNEAYWGDSLRFFNEGMAEYLESITSTGEIPPFDFSWLTHQHYPKQISTLLFSEVDWHGDQRHELYQNSKALFHFLMSHESGKKVVWKIMKLEMEEPCTTLPKEVIEKILFDIFPNHQQDFDYWFINGRDNFVNSKQAQ